MLAVEKHELDVLVRDLDHVGDDLTDDIADVTEDYINRVKRDAQAGVRGFAHLPHLARSFTAEVTHDRNEVEGEAGAEWARLQGRLDVYIEYGTPTSPPHPHWAPAHDRWAPLWQERIELLLVDRVERRRT